MNEWALRIAIASLEGSRSSLHWWLEFFTALVVVGVTLEVVFVIWEYWEDLQDFRRGIVHPPERPSLLLLVLGLFGAVLVAVGVAGELREESKIEGIETQIRKANDELYLLLSKEAGDAASSAKTAHAELGAVEKKADELNGQLAMVSKRAEGIDAELAQAEFLMSARTIGQPKALSEALKKTFKGRDITLRSYVGDHEGWGLCTALWYVAHDAEMNPRNECGFGQLTAPLISPLAVSGPDVNETVVIGGLLVTVGRLWSGATSGIKGPNLMIFVGAKSPFITGQARGVKAAKTKQPNKTMAKPQP